MQSKILESSQQGWPTLAVKGVWQIKPFAYTNHILKEDVPKSETLFEGLCWVLRGLHVDLRTDTKKKCV